MVPSCKVGYRIPNPKETFCEYSGGSWVSVSRSIQRLTLLLPKEEQDCELIVDNNTVKPGMKKTEEKEVKAMRRKREKWIVKNRQTLYRTKPPFQTNKKIKIVKET